MLVTSNVILRALARSIFIITIPIMSLGGCVSDPREKEELTPKALLGKQLFYDPSLSDPVGQSCASCHNPNVGFSNGFIVAAGADKLLFGNRNTPTISYMAYSPSFFYDRKEKTFVGGVFLDGRANSLEEQIAQVLLNPLEMGNKDNASLVAKVRSSNLSSSFEKLFGENIWADPEKAFTEITRVIAAYERSVEVNSFSSKYDYYLKGKVHLTALEKQGLNVFEDEKKGNCSSCHPSRTNGSGEPPLFTDFSYDNLGVPRMKTLAFYNMGELYNPLGEKYIDIGLANNPHVKNKRQVKGKFKVPTLRNIDKTAPYMHNGVFETLEDVIDFYNERDVRKKWGPPEVSENINMNELGNLKLSEKEAKALVAFLKTLSDGFVPE